MLDGCIGKVQLAKELGWSWHRLIKFLDSHTACLDSVTEYKYVSASEGYTKKCYRYPSVLDKIKEIEERENIKADVFLGRVVDSVNPDYTKSKRSKWCHHRYKEQRRRFQNCMRNGVIYAGYDGIVNPPKFNNFDGSKYKNIEKG